MEPGFCSCYALEYLSIELDSTGKERGREEGGREEGGRVRKEGGGRERKKHC